MINTIKIQDLSKKDAYAVLELIHDCLSCATQDEFRLLIFKLKNLISFDVATCLISKKDNAGPTPSLDVVNVNYPSEWVEYYLSNQFQRIDPILKTNFQHFRLQYWEDTYRKFPPPKNFLFIAHDFGLRSGYTHGVRNYNGDEGSLFSIAGGSLEKNNRTETILNLTIPHFHQAFCRVAAHSKIKSNPLTEREKEVLNWIKEGKNTWEISVILHIAERTVHFHVQNIIRKLNASSRTHALAIALEEKIIDNL